jgi:hypothetical protein
MGYSILKYGSLMLTDIEDLEQAKEKALQFVTPNTERDFIEIRDPDNETVTIGYFDGRRFHWTKDKGQTDAWKEGFVTKPPLWRERGKPERKSS